MLKIEHVSKRFGDKKVLNDVSFNVPENSIFGFVGQNGAGKTTTMKMILGLMQADDGSISVNGEKVCYGSDSTNRFIGYLPDVPEFYPYMTAKEYLYFCGEITEMDRDECKARTEELLKLVGLDKETHRIKGYSRGMKQRLGIAQALLNRPKLLICDEPTSALDPVGRKEILDILVSAKEETTVLFSTHILSDVERICDRIAFLHNGKIQFSGSTEDVKAICKESGFEVELEIEEEQKKLLSRFPKGKVVNSTHLVYENGTDKQMEEILSYILQNHMAIRKIEKCQPTLESVFMEVVSK